MREECLDDIYENELRIRKECYTKGFRTIFEELIKETNYLTDELQLDAYSIIRYVTTLELIHIERINTKSKKRNIKRSKPNEPLPLFD